MADQNFSINETRDQVTWTIEELSLKMIFNSETISELITTLGMMRAQMTPEVERFHKFGQVVSAIPDPVWATEDDLMSGLSLIHLRDPRFGWLHYALPPNEAENLGNFLLKQAESSSEKLKSDKPN